MTIFTKITIATLLTLFLNVICFAQFGLPAGLTVVNSGNQSLTVSWSAVQDATSYQIFQKAGTGDYIQLPASVSANSFTVGNLNFGTNYCFKIKAVSSTQVSEFSSEACNLLNSPVATPQLKSLSEGRASPYLNLDIAPIENTYPLEGNLEIYISENGAEFVLVPFKRYLSNDPVSNNRQFEIGYVTLGKNYCVKFKQNVNGDLSDFSNTLCFKPTTNTLVAPSIISGGSGFTGKFFLQVATPSNLNVGQTYFEFYQKLETDVDFKLMQTQYEFRYFYSNTIPLLANNNYCFAYRYVDGGGNKSPFSNSFCINLPNNLPKHSINSIVELQNRSINVDLNPTEPLYQNLNFAIYRSTNSSAPVKIATIDQNGQVINSLPSVNATSKSARVAAPIFNDNSNLSPGTTYCYTVVLTDGVNESPASDPVCVTTAGAAPLPVRLISFEAKTQGTSVDLLWRTASEINFEKFDIQKSANAQTWETLSTQAALGNAKEKASYQYTDLNSPYDINYYRLKMIDKDGSVAYSNVVSAAIGSQSLIYPNPLKQGEAINLKSSIEIASIELRDMSGRKFKIELNGNGQVDTKKLLPGTYLIKLMYKNGTAKTSKLMLF